MKRLLALIMAAAMVLALVPMTAMAAEQHVFVGEVGYDTIKDAYEANKASLPVTITIKGTYESKLSDTVNDMEANIVGADSNAKIIFDESVYLGTSEGTGYYSYRSTLKFSNLIIDKKYDGSAFYEGLGFRHSKKVTYENCVIDCVVTTYADTVEFIGCTFNEGTKSNYYAVYFYGSDAALVKNCTFNYGDRAIKVYNEGGAAIKLTVDGSKFVCRDGYTDNKAAIEVDDTVVAGKGIKYTVDVKNSELDCRISKGWVQVNDGAASTATTLNVDADSNEEKHDVGAFTVVKEPTATETGLKQATCGGCGETVKEIIPMLAPTPIPEEAPIPETGDGMGLFVFAGLALVSMLGMVVMKKREF